MNPPLPPSLRRPGGESRDQDLYRHIRIHSARRCHRRLSMWSRFGFAGQKKGRLARLERPAEDMQHTQPIVIHVLYLCGPFLLAHKERQHSPSGVWQQDCSHQTGRVCISTNSTYTIFSLLKA